MNTLLKWVLTLSVIFSFACSQIKNPQLSAFNAFDRTGMLINLGNNIVVPSYSSFAEHSDSLYAAALRFAATPDNASLVNFQNFWLLTDLDWKGCEVYNFGPALNNGNAVNIQSNFIISATSVESAVGNAPAVYDSSFVEKQTTDVRGISVMEYLLFDPVGGNSTILNNFTGKGNASLQRMSYLKGLAYDIKSNAHTLLNAWLPSDGNYLQTFINANGNDVNSSIGFLVNQIVYMNDYIKNYKIGRPLGIRIKASNGPALPTYVETYYSSHAFDCLTANFKSIDNLYFGVGNNGIKNSGLGDLVTAVKAEDDSGQPLSISVRQQLDSIYYKINVIKVPLESAVVNDASQVNELYVSSKQLLVLLKLDMVNNLGVVLTTTDNDGD